MTEVSLNTPVRNMEASDNATPEDVQKLELLKDGLRFAKRATNLDHEGKYLLAIQLYGLAIEQFKESLQYNTDSSYTKLIESKCDLYQKRVDYLETLDLSNQSTSGVKSVVNNREIGVSHSGMPLSESALEVSINKDMEQLHVVNQIGTPIRDTQPTNTILPVNYSSPAPSTGTAVAVRENYSPAVIQNIETASDLLEKAHEAEEKGELDNAIMTYNKALHLLYQAYEAEPDPQVKEVVRVKYNVFVTRVEELVETIPPENMTITANLAKHLRSIDSYTFKARQLADNLNFGDSVKYYNMALAEIKNTMDSEEYAVAKKWLAKRILVTERRIGGVETALKYVKMALPYPWNTIFGLVTISLQSSGFITNTQTKLDRELSKMAGMEAPPEPLHEIRAAKIEEKKNKKKKKRLLF